MQLNTQEFQKIWSSCSGCGVCVLPCPVWQWSRDVTLTPHGQAKMLQSGATPNELAETTEPCTLCGACESVCPEDMDALAMILHLRGASPNLGDSSASSAGWNAGKHNGTLLVSDDALAHNPELLTRITALLTSAQGHEVVRFDGGPFSERLCQGESFSAAECKAQLPEAKTYVVADGMILRALRRTMPAGKVISLGEALLRMPKVLESLRRTDFYVIEPRAFHANLDPALKLYDSLRRERGLEINLDLQRRVIATGYLPDAHVRRVDWHAQIDWIMQGRSADRIVVESAEDLMLYGDASALPVTHLADLA